MRRAFEIVLPYQRALLELGFVEAEELLSDRVEILAGAELGGDFLTALVPHFDRAAREVTLDRVADAVRLAVELDAEDRAFPRPPALERRDHAVRAAIVVEPVERGGDRGE